MGNNLKNKMITKFTEFKSYMDDQIVEIINYKNERLKKQPNVDINQCIFEWIQKNAENFRKSWNK